ncbi:centromere-associated protein E-like [Clytia hemisphaerica]|uniref:centromere-associated protein E-like n=1 Tax=Clytia hemisphaerica TaxID=252671 RepID=UPI0034D71C60
MFCLPIVSFFKAIGDFRKTIGELKCSLVHLKEVFSSLLRISQDIEDLTGEVKNIVEFYTIESKTTIRGQLDNLITSEASQELYYKDFYNYFRYLVNNELVRLVHEFGYGKQVLDVAMRILAQLKETVGKIVEVVPQDIQRIQILNQISDFITQIEQNIISDFDRNKENAEACSKVENISIRLFCEQEKLSHEFEQTLASGLGVFLKTQNEPMMCPSLETEFIKDRTSNDFHFEKEELYRKRTTRIRELRHYLSSKIKLKKIGDYYREEISLQIQLDLKHASETLQKHEAPIHTTIEDWIQILHQLPKHHFKEVFDDVKVSETSNALEKIIEKKVAPELDDLIKDINVPKTLKKMERQIVKKGKKALANFKETNKDGKLNIILTGLKELAFVKEVRLISIVEQALDKPNCNDDSDFGILSKLNEKKENILSKLESIDLEQQAVDLVQKKLISGHDVVSAKVQELFQKLEKTFKEKLENKDATKSLLDLFQRQIKPWVVKDRIKRNLETGLQFMDQSNLRNGDIRTRSYTTGSIDFQTPEKMFRVGDNSSVAKASELRSDKKLEEFHLVKEGNNQYNTDIRIAVVKELIENFSGHGTESFKQLLVDHLVKGDVVLHIKELIGQLVHRLMITTENIDIPTAESQQTEESGNNNIKQTRRNSIENVKRNNEDNFDFNRSGDRICCKDGTEDVISNILYIDHETLQKDVQSVMRPLIEMALQSSSKLAVFAVDKSLFATSEIIELGLTLLKSLKNSEADVHMIDQQNIWLGSLIRALPPPCQQDARKLIFLWKVLHQRKNLRTEFMEKVREKITDQIVEPSTSVVSRKMETYFADILQRFISSSK